MVAEPSGPPAAAAAEKKTLRSRAGHVREQVAGVRGRVDDLRPRHRSLDVALSTSEHDQRVGGGLLAGAVAFRLFLWLLPAALVLIGGLGFLTPNDAERAARSTGLRNFMVSAISTASSESQRARWAVLVVGLVLLYFASAALGRTVSVAIALAWGIVPVKPRNPLKAAGATTGVLLVALAAGGLSARVRAVAPGFSILAEIGLTVVWVGLWWAALQWLPRPATVSGRQLWPGAVLMGVGVQVLHLVTVLYLSNKIYSASALYGTLGGAATLLLWAYLNSRLVIGSAALNATLARLRAAAPPTTPTG